MPYFAEHFFQKPFPNWGFCSWSGRTLDWDTAPSCSSWVMCLWWALGAGGLYFKCSIQITALPHEQCWGWVYSPNRTLKSPAKAGGAGTTRVLWCFAQPASSCWQHLAPRRAAAPGAPLSFSSHLQSFRLGEENTKDTSTALKCTVGSSAWESSTADFETYFLLSSALPDQKTLQMKVWSKVSLTKQQFSDSIPWFG